VTLSHDERLVVDASVAIKWVVPEAGSEQAIILLEHGLVAADLLFSECANILWRKQRHGFLTADEADVAARTLEQADLAIVSTRGYLARAVAIAVELDHPAYDAIYLAVAEAFGLRLAMADHRLIRKTEQSSPRFRNMWLPLSDIPPAGYSA
jgi:predicted nucleic acid-binding protein